MKLGCGGKSLRLDCRSRIWSANFTSPQVILRHWSPDLRRNLIRRIQGVSRCCAYVSTHFSSTSRSCSRSLLTCRDIRSRPYRSTAISSFFSKWSYRAVSNAFHSLIFFAWSGSSTTIFWHGLCKLTGACQLDLLIRSEELRSVES